VTQIAARTMTNKTRDRASFRTWYCSVVVMYFRFRTVLEHPAFYHVYFCINAFDRLSDQGAGSLAQHFGYDKRTCAIVSMTRLDGGRQVDNGS